MTQTISENAQIAGTLSITTAPSVLTGLTGLTAIHHSAIAKDLRSQRDRQNQ